MIYAISGKRKSGKSTAALELQKLAEVKFINLEIFSFAGTLKDDFSKVMGVDRSLLDHPTYKEEYREGMQTFGEKMRSQDPMYWIKKFDKLTKKSEHIVCDDLRFFNELIYFMKKKATIIRVHADTKIRKQRGWVLNPLIDNHISETDLDMSLDTWRAIGHYCYNNRSLDELADDLQLILNKLIR